PYEIAVEYDLTTSAPGFEINVHLGAEEITLQTSASGPGRFAWWTDFGSVPLDGPIPFSVVIDPQCAIDGSEPSTTNHRLISGFLTPRPPTTVVDYYDPRELVGTQKTSIVFSSTDIDSLTFMSGKPDAGPGQKPINDGSMTGQINGSRTFTVASRP